MEVLYFGCFVLEAPLHNVEVKKGAHPNLGEKYKMATMPNLASTNRSIR